MEYLWALLNMRRARTGDTWNVSNKGVHKENQYMQKRHTKSAAVRLMIVFGDSQRESNKILGF